MQNYASPATVGHSFASDRNVFRCLNPVINDISRSPFEGSRRQERLTEILSARCSPQITEEHWVVYRVVGAEGNQAVTVASCRTATGGSADPITQSRETGALVQDAALDLASDALRCDPCSPTDPMEPIRR